MKVYILPGFSPGNRSWLEQIRQDVSQEFEAIDVAWSHWDDASVKFSVETEAKRIIRDTAGETSFSIVAKSIGTLVAMHIFRVVGEKIEKMALCGIPVNDLQAGDLEFYKELGRVAKENVYLTQNLDDPHGSHEQVEKLVRENNPALNVGVKNRADHEYFYGPEIVAFLRA